MDRWDRLERYARWKSDRMKLEKMPNDIISYMIRSFLPYTDMRNLLTAMSGRYLDISCKADNDYIPDELRLYWIEETVTESFIAYLHSMTEFACFHAAHTTTVVQAFIDWSPFSPIVPMPVADYAWNNAHTTVNIHRDCVRYYITTCVKQRKPCVRISFHKTLRWNHQNILHPDPIMATEFNFIPHFLV